MTKSLKKRGYSDEYITEKLKLVKMNLKEATSKYPDRVYLADTTKWTVEPSKIMEGVYRFLGLEWNIEYLLMDAVNAKRVPGEIKKPEKYVCLHIFSLIFSQSITFIHTTQGVSFRWRSTLMLRCRMRGNFKYSRRR